MGHLMNLSDDEKFLLAEYVVRTGHKWKSQLEWEFVAGKLDEDMKRVVLKLGQKILHLLDTAELRRFYFAKVIRG